MGVNPLWVLKVGLKTNQATGGRRACQPLVPSFDAAEWNSV